MSEEFFHGYALLIGVGESAYKPLSLPVTVKDTQAIYTALIDPELYAYSENKIRVLNNEEATRDNILEGLKWLKEQAEADSKATIFIYYSGHGYLNIADDQYYLLPHDVDPLDIPSSALGAKSFIEALRKIIAEKLLVVIDSCHAAGMATSKDATDILSADKAVSEKFKGLNAVPLEPSLLKKFMQSKGRVVLTSSRGEQKSWIRLDQKLSIYTHHFLEALHGASNKPGDTEVRVSNLIQHLGQAVPQSVMEHYKQEQTPIADMTNAEDFVIAKLRGRKIPGNDPNDIQVWRYLHTFTGHTGAVNALIITPDGQKLISASDDQTIKVWSLTTMQLLQDFSKGLTSVTQLLITPDGKFIVSGSAGGTIKIWQLETGELVHTFSGVHENSITALAISPDSRTLVTAAMDKKIKIWDFQTKQLIQTLSATNSYIKAMVISPDGNRLITGSKGETIEYWELETGKTLNTLLNAHTSSVNAILVRPENQELITASSDQTIKIWNWKTRELKYTLDAGQTPVLSIAISQDGSILISGSEGGTAKLWDLETRELIYFLGGVHYSRINSVAISPDAQIGVTGSKAGNVKIWRKDKRLKNF
ncbi:MAG: hypothetical protein F6K17_26815 [Okeania sp. SIO3C4]|nr:hypothetical protein [Okeania sp. SIO3C4]